jgi:MFS family permease
LAAAFFAFRLLPTKQEKDDSSKDLDGIGVALFGAAVVCLMLPFLLTTGGKSDDPLRWWWLSGVPIFGAAFAFWELRYTRRGKSPIIHFDLFRQSSYRNGVFLATAYFAALPASFLVTTLYLQEGLKIQPVFAGLVTLPFAVTAGAAAWIGGRLVSRFGRGLVVVGVLGAAAGVALLLVAATLPPPAATEWCMAAAMLVAGAGGGLVVSPNQTLTLSDVPVTQGSIAGSMAQLGQRIGTAIGVSLVTSVFFATLSAGADGGRVARYHDAFRVGFFVSLALMLIALAIGVLDLFQRRRQPCHEQRKSRTRNHREIENRMK